jgi:hypothetical protein
MGQKLKFWYLVTLVTLVARPLKSNCDEIQVERCVEERRK